MDPSYRGVYDKLEHYAAPGTGCCTATCPLPSVSGLSNPIYTLKVWGVGNPASRDNEADSVRILTDPVHFWSYASHLDHVSSDAAVVAGEPQCHGAMRVGLRGNAPSSYL